MVTAIIVVIILIAQRKGREVEATGEKKYPQPETQGFLLA